MGKTLNKKQLENEIKRRRTFAIISHPDAGKTTITETLLLYGGAIRETGTVKGRHGNYATSDWMEIEKQRGISVTSSVMQFDYDDKKINILDTPGHEDFSEDTYRTLMAVDSAVMVVDSGNGIEEQTEKLFKVCRMRGIPIFTFINKLDRVGRDPLDLVTELEEVLEIDAYPMNWPIGMGKDLIGNFDIYNNRVEFNRPEDNRFSNGERYVDLDEDGQLPEGHPLNESSLYHQASEEALLLKEAGNAFDPEGIAMGLLTPVFFGSALTNFGVETFLNGFLDFAPSPSNHKDKEGDVVEAVNEQFSGFIFKIQANMDPRHRDRIGFLRITSGEFDRGMSVRLARTNKDVRLSNSTQFLAEERETVETAVAGDIIGLYDTGTFQIGDTIYEGKDEIVYSDLPEFTPELFMSVEAKNAMKQKSFYKGLEQLVQEGAIQLYKRWHTESFILGAVGQLQFEVFQHRLLNEYNSEIRMEPVGRKIARWIHPDDLDEKMSSSRNLLVRDRFDRPVFLFESEFAERFFRDKYPEVRLYTQMDV